MSVTTNATTLPRPQAILLRESSWGLISTAVQVLAMTAFFVLVAHHYSKLDLAKFMVANTVYQLMASISTLGLSSWFIREREQDTSGNAPAAFLRVQLVSGSVFFLLTAATGCFYADSTIRELLLLLGVTILADSFLYSVKSLAISQDRQQNVVRLQLLDAGARLLAVGGAIVLHASIVTMVTGLVGLRLVVAAGYATSGRAQDFAIGRLFSNGIPWRQMGVIVGRNWYFVVLGSVSLLYWRTSNFLVFNFLSLHDVANYEVAFRVFSIAQMLPIVVAGSLLPRLVMLLSQGQEARAKRLMAFSCRLGFVYGLLVWSIIQSFGGYLIPFVFGAQYQDAQPAAAHMAFTLLLFPTGILQASLLTALKLERKDMWFNVISLAACIVFAVGGLFFVARALWVVNLAIFASFLLFHLCQDVLLVRRQFIRPRQLLLSYALAGSMAVLCWAVQQAAEPLWGFSAFWGLGLLGGLGVMWHRHQQHPALLSTIRR